MFSIVAEKWVGQELGFRHDKLETIRLPSRDAEEAVDLQMWNSWMTFWLEVLILESSSYRRYL